MKEIQIDDGSRDKEGNVLLVTCYQCECKKDCQSWDFNKEYIKDTELIHLRIEGLKKEFDERIIELFKKEIEVMKKYGAILAKGNIYDLE